MIGEKNKRDITEQGRCETMMHSRCFSLCCGSSIFNSYKLSLRIAVTVEHRKLRPVCRKIPRSKFWWYQEVKILGVLGLGADTEMLVKCLRCSSDRT